MDYTAETGPVQAGNAAGKYFFPGGNSYCIYGGKLLKYIIIIVKWRSVSVYLKSLEIQGFKSFADKTVLRFDNDITAIVGPNGSGKSNISDAISWVLGEMSSKALRGAKMEDVIFGGTQKRSQLGFAEASLVLDNSDGALPVETPEVTVT